MTLEASSACVQGEDKGNDLSCAKGEEPVIVMMVMEDGDGNDRDE